MADIRDPVDMGYLARGTRAISRDDIAAALRRAKELEARMSSGPLSRYWDEGRLLLGLLADWWAGRYRDVSWKTVAATAFALLYVLNPMDIVPDVIVGAGLLDDATVMGLALKMIGEDLRRYKVWRSAGSDVTDVASGTGEQVA